MRKEGNDRPIVDATGKGLGVRGTPVNGVVDVDLDDDRRVLLNGKGMSVAPRWRDLPFFLISRRLTGKIPSARGSSSLFCFTMGEGAFDDGEVTPALSLVVDDKKHGVVAPQSLVPLDEYQADLAATRDGWSIDEE